MGIKASRPSHTDAPGGGTYSIPHAILHPDTPMDDAKHASCPHSQSSMPMDKNGWCGNCGYPSDCHEY